MSRNSTATITLPSLRTLETVHAAMLVHAQTLVPGDWAEEESAEAWSEVQEVYRQIVEVCIMAITHPYLEDDDFDTLCEWEKLAMRWARDSSANERIHRQRASKK